MVYELMMNDRFAYKHSVDQCDVEDMAGCEQFRKKRRQWMEWLSGDDPHSIIKQIYSAVWDYALFCTVNELRRIAAENPEEGIGFNGPVIRLFDAGFATTQATAIRRLIEWPARRPDRKVISIRTVLKDIRDNISLITRENYVCYDGLPYDYEKVRDEAFAKLPVNESGVSVGSMPISGPEGWPMAERMHKNFDRLAQVEPKKRSRTELIKEEIFDHLETLIKPCEKVKKYVDKFIAHGAAPETRGALAEDEGGLTLERIESCHKIIYRVASFINGQLLWESGIGGVPVSQYDHLKGLDMHWASEDGLIKAQEKWHEITKEVGNWDGGSLLPPNFK
jgi:hypothetical protein